MYWKFKEYKFIDGMKKVKPFVAGFKHNKRIEMERDSNLNSLNTLTV